MTRFWHQRILDALALVGFFVLSLYVFELVAPMIGTTASYSISVPTAAIAGALTVFAVVFGFWAPRKFLRGSIVLTFGVAIALSVSLLYDSETLGTPFLMLWVALAFTSALIQRWYNALFIAIGTVYGAIAALNGDLTIELGLMIIISTLLPAIIGWVIWGRRASDRGMDEDERSYRQLADELSQVAGKAEIVINAIDDGVVAVNNDGNIELINPAAQKLIGWGRQDALGLNYSSVIKLLDDQDHAPTKDADPVAQVIASNKQCTDDSLTLLTNSDKKVLISLVVSPIGQKGDGVIMVFRDITNQKAHELQQTEFISTASHEMRTPVAAIEGYLGLVLNPQTATIDDKAREFITKAHDNAQHLGKLFQDLLDVTKTDDGRMTFTPEVTEVGPFVKDVFDTLSGLGAEKNLEMRFLPDRQSKEKSGKFSLLTQKITPVYLAHLDQNHLREILSNLIENAVKYTPEGSVSVDVEGDEKTVRIRVIDTGIGIPKEDQPHLFQKFYRIDNSDTREIGGTGLGLYLSRRLAEQMGGKIWVDSEHKKGSVFTLEFPRLTLDQAKQIKERPQPTPETTPTDEVAQTPVPTTLETQPPVTTPPVAAPTTEISTPSAPQPASPAPARVTPPQPTSLPPLPPPVPRPKPEAEAANPRLIIPDRKQP